MDGYDLPGSDFRDFALVKRGETRDIAASAHRSLGDRVDRQFADECREECGRDRQCKAWTAHVTDSDWESDSALGPFRLTRRGRCYLKDAVPSPVLRRERGQWFVSGVKPAPPTVQRQPQPPASTEPPPPPPTGERLPERGMSVAENTNRPGHDYRAVDLDYAQAINCGRLCMEDPRCRAWTAVKPGIQGPKMQCWLKDAVPRPIRDECCTSGVTPPRR